MRRPSKRKKGFFAQRKRPRQTSGPLTLGEKAWIPAKRYERLAGIQIEGLIAREGAEEGRAGNGQIAASNEAAQETHARKR